MTAVFRRLMFGSALSCILAAPARAFAKSNVLFILDVSNSMWGQVQGEAKITSAQNAMSSLLRDFPKDSSVGFMAYGHRDAKSCDDIELISDIGASKPDELIAKIKKL